MYLAIRGIVSYIFYESKGILFKVEKITRASFLILWSLIIYDQVSLSYL